MDGIIVAIAGIIIMIIGYILTKPRQAGDRVHPMSCAWCLEELHYPVCVWKDRPICVSCLQKQHR